MQNYREHETQPSVYIKNLSHITTCTHAISITSKLHTVWAFNIIHNIENSHQSRYTQTCESLGQNYKCKHISIPSNTHTHTLYMPTSYLAVIRNRVAWDSKNTDDEC